MNLAEIFGPAWIGAGTRGFFGEAYWHHRLPIPGNSFEGSTFVGKTTTLEPNCGNMKLTNADTPAHFLPDCIHVDLIQGIMLNSVKLSGPGFYPLLHRGTYQYIRDPYFLSFMAIAEDIEDQAAEAEEFVSGLYCALPFFRTRQLGIQVNLTCPSVGTDMSTIVPRAKRLLPIFGRLGIPTVPKLNLLTSPKEAAEIGKDPHCAGLCVSNSFPYGKVLSEAEWQRLFPRGSPLAARGYEPGGLSGKPLLLPVESWAHEFRAHDSTTHLNLGGGIMRKGHVDLLKQAGADSISFSGVTVLRPWRTQGIIRRAHEIFA